MYYRAALPFVTTRIGAPTKKAEILHVVNDIEYLNRIDIPYWRRKTYTLYARVKNIKFFRRGAITKTGRDLIDRERKIDIHICI